MLFSSFKQWYVIGKYQYYTVPWTEEWRSNTNLSHFVVQVLAVRYKDHTESYTKLHKAPNIYPGFYRERVVLELKGAKHSLVIIIIDNE